MKLTASKESRAALARGNSGEGFSSDGRGDFGALVVGVSSLSASVASVANASAGFGGVGVGRAAGGTAMVGVVVWKGTGSCKSCKDESRDDFELHIVLFFYVVKLNTEY